MAYPTGDELQAFLVNAGMIEANSNEALDYQGYMSAAIARWEADTQYQPFFTATTQTRTFDTPDGYILELGGGLLEAEGTPIITMDGRTLVEGVDYDFKPLNASYMGKPYLAIKFRYPLVSKYANPANITIEGYFGYCTALPSDAAKAILSIAAKELMASASGTSGAIQAIKQDDVTIQYAGVANTSSQFTAQQLQLESYYVQTLSRYRRVRLY